MKKKPCPFCGGKRLFVSKSDCSWHEPAFAYSVGCAGADCHGHIFALGHDLFKTEKEAVEAWNERAEDDEIEKLRAALKSVMVGGNHLACVIGPNHLLHTASYEDALKHYGPGVIYDVWCCWKNIMEARAVLGEKE